MQLFAEAAEMAEVSWRFRLAELETTQIDRITSRAANVCSQLLTMVSQVSRPVPFHQSQYLQLGRQEVLERAQMFAEVHTQFLPESGIWLMI